MASTLTAPDDLDEEIVRQWAALAAPGAVLDGEQRVAAAAVARGGDPGGALTGPASEAAHLVGRDPATITQERVDDLQARGLAAESYVEIVGVASRTVAIDTFERGVGRPVRPLPTPATGAPSGEIAVGARKRSGFVPTVGPCSPPTAVSLVPQEARLQEALHSALYLSYESMLDLAGVRDLTRPELELVATRTSLINACFF